MFKATLTRIFLFRCEFSLKFKAVCINLQVGRPGDFKRDTGNRETGNGRGTWNGRWSLRPQTPGGDLERLGGLERPGDLEWPLETAGDLERPGGLERHWQGDFKRPRPGPGRGEEPRSTVQVAHWQPESNLKARALLRREVARGQRPGPQPGRGEVPRSTVASARLSGKGHRASGTAGRLQTTVTRTGGLGSTCKWDGRGT